MFFVEKWVQKNNTPLLFSGLRSSRGSIKKGIQFRNSIPGRERILTPGMGRDGLGQMSALARGAWEELYMCT